MSTGGSPTARMEFRIRPGDRQLRTVCTTGSRPTAMVIRPPILAQERARVAEPAGALGAPAVLAAGCPVAAQDLPETLTLGREAELADRSFLCNRNIATSLGTTVPIRQPHRWIVEPTPSSSIIPRSAGLPPSTLSVYESGVGILLAMPLSHAGSLRDERGYLKTKT